MIFSRISRNFDWKISLILNFKLCLTVIHELLNKSDSKLAFPVKAQENKVGLFKHIQFCQLQDILTASWKKCLPQQTHFDAKVFIS